MEAVSYLLGKKAGGGGGSTPTGTINITENGIVNVSSYASADVNVQPDLEAKSITITENGTTTLTPTTGKDGISSVSITTNVSGGGGRDWSQLGYAEEPTFIDEGYDLALEYKQNADATPWGSVQSSDTLNDGKNFNKKNVFFPKISNINNVQTMDIKNCAKLVVFIGENETITPRVGSMGYIFNGCKSLVEFPYVDLSLQTESWSFAIGFMFDADCTNLSDKSLDNILRSCISFTRKNSNKTLSSFCKFTKEMYPASRIEALPHYQDFVNAGWSIGYTDD